MFLPKKKIRSVDEKEEENVEKLFNKLDLLLLSHFSYPATLNAST